MKQLATACMLLGMASLGLAQSTSSPDDGFISATQARIAALDHRLLDIGDATQRQMDTLACRPNCPPGTSERLGRDMQTAMDVVLSQIQAEVDGFVLHTADTSVPDLNKAVVARGLEQILPNSGQWRAVFQLNSGARRSLVVVYALLSGHVNGSSVTLRAYKEVPGDIRRSGGSSTTLTLADTTGRDMNGYLGPSITELHPTTPSVPGKLFLLLSGVAMGANGPNTRMRLYRFDGDQFKTIWMPENVWGSFDIDTMGNWFTVTGEYYQEDRKRNDRYFVDDDYVALAPLR